MIIGFQTHAFEDTVVKENHKNPEASVHSKLARYPTPE